MILAQEALKRLEEGNCRFASGVFPVANKLAARQEPFAIILGYSVSRTSAEIIFDQSFGDIFVIRIARNIAAPFQVGSLEFAVKRFGTGPVIVDHSKCGAILAIIEKLSSHPETSHKIYIRSLIVSAYS